MRVPWGSQKAEPGETSSKKKSFWSVPIFRWLRFAASARKVLYSSRAFLSGNEIPEIRWTDSFLLSPSQYAAEFYTVLDRRAK